ncbi:MAG TPA: DUF2958 domain-containing protein [Allosphingosinicella sp.]|nr:DUF2958 domain-containing protein [Allosphingosinicella sp.]
MISDTFLPDELAEQLRANGCGPDSDHLPVVKFFNPAGPATWLATELAGDCDTLFGLADLGFGCPELGTFSLAELRTIRLPFGLSIERDKFFSTEFRLSAWAEAARAGGSIATAEQILAAAARSRLADP